jgi:DNA-binding CsgD family transcriptional regulator
MIQQGQVFKLKAKGPGEQTLWAYRYRLEGRGSERPQVGGLGPRGKLDADAVAAVLSAAGHPVARRRDWPGGLTTREVDVLRLLSRGLSNKDIATQLVITSRTARDHIKHIYAKIDASSRVAASLFATEHGLL